MPDDHDDQVARLCPAHKLELVAAATRYGRRHTCPVHGCTVACWDGETSTPADAETRAARQRAHAEFDRLWRDPLGAFHRLVPPGPRRKQRARSRAYAWLSMRLGLTPARTHIGMFDAETCRQVVRMAREVRTERAVL